MTVTPFRVWRVRTIIIARTFLAATLLLGASVGVSHRAFSAEIVFLFELLLGAAIAAGWRMRYAAALVFLGTIGARVLAPHLQLVPVPTNMGTTAAVLIASGILACCGASTARVWAALIDENSNSASGHPHALARGPREEDLEVTMRLEDGRLRSLWRRRCIVTIYERAAGVRNTGREAWYAKDGS